MVRKYFVIGCYNFKNCKVGMLRVAKPYTSVQTKW